MAYLRMGSEDSSLGFFGCGPECSCARCRVRNSPLAEWYVPDDDDDEPPRPSPVQPPPKPAPAPPARTGLGELSAFMRQFAERERFTPLSPSQQFGGLGWTVRFLGAPAGHEQITLAALGPASTVTFSLSGRPVTVKLSPGDVAEIMRGNTDTDIKYFRRGAIIPGVVSTFRPADQRQHALRATYGQSQSAALRDIVNELKTQHSLMVAERLPRRRLYRIGHATHLVQDSFSPAHTLRRAPASCIAYIRNYGINPRGTDEHKVPRDARDEVAKSAGASKLAEKATRKYLQIAFKAIHGKTKPDPVASREAETEFNHFLTAIFPGCLITGPPPKR